LKLFVRIIIFLGLVTFAIGNLRAQENPAPAQSAPAAAQTNSPPAPQSTYQISGNVHSGKTPLPGVTLTATNTLTGKKYTAATISDGTFAMIGLPRGRYVLRAEFMGFAAQTQEVVLNPENPSGKAELELILASRQEETNQRTAATTNAGRGFQSLSIDSAEAAPTAGESGLAVGAAQNPSANDLAGLPLNGAGADAPTESVSISGVQGRTQDFGQGNEGELQDRIQEFRDRAQQNGAGAFGGDLGSTGGRSFGSAIGRASSLGAGAATRSTERSAAPAPGSATLEVVWSCEMESGDCRAASF